MNVLATGRELLALALDGADDPHLADGVHLRIVPGRGLPVAPIQVRRRNLGPGAETAPGLRRDAVFRDETGAVLTPPFALRPDREVTVEFPDRGRDPVVWARVEIARVELQVGGGGRAPRGLRSAGVRRLSTVGGSVLRGGRGLGRRAVAEGLVRRGLVRVEPRPGATLPVRVEARAYDDLGEPVLLAARETAPFDVAASDIHHLRIRGHGTVRGVSWVGARGLGAELKPPLWREWALPLGAARRHRTELGDDEAAALAFGRVLRGAPERRGLHDEPAAAAPARATALEERARVRALASALVEPLRALLDGPTAPEDLRHDLPPLQTDRGPSSEASMPALPFVLSGAVDPGVARWLGLGDRDEAVPAQDGDVVAYVIDMAVAWDPGASALEARSVQARRFVPAGIPGLAGLGLPERSVDGRPHLLLRAVACATLGAPPLPPAAPSAALAPGAFVPPPPQTPAHEARREVVLDLDGLLPLSVLMLARRDGQQVTGLNPRLRPDGPAADALPPEGRALALTAEPRPASRDGGAGRVRDREAENVPLHYRLAQADLFGRWSGVTELAAPALEPPPPPVPQLQCRGRAPEVGRPVPEGALAGQVAVRVPVPPPASLPAGSRPLTALELRTDRGGRVVVPVGGDGAVLQQLGGPPLGRGAAGALTVRARWQVDGGAPGAWAEQEVVLVDPRPPVPVELPITLAYTERPDPLGEATLILEVPTVAGQGYRVYTADETRLVASARAAAAQDAHLGAFVAAWDAAEGALLGRAQALREHGRAFRIDWFRKLTTADLPGDGAPLRVAHGLSAGLRTLTLMKVVAVGPNGVPADFSASSVAPFAVPRQPAPVEPLLELVPGTTVPPEGPVVQALRVRVGDSESPPVRWRLRRSRVSGLDPARMPVVASGAVPPRPAEGPWEFDIVDEGGLPGRPDLALERWNHWAWRVEVQAGVLEGTGVVDGQGRRLPETPEARPGAWSRPSAPVSRALVPAVPPPAPEVLAVEQGPSGVTLQWRAAVPPGGSLGHHRFEVLREQPGRPVERVASLLATGRAEDPGGADDQGVRRWTDSAPPAGARWHLRTVDPLGRHSAAATATLS